MFKNKKILLYSITTVILSSIAILAVLILTNNNKGNKNNEIKQKLYNTNVKYDYEDTDIDWKSSQYTELELNNKSITITKAGTYHITGSIEDGDIKVNAESSDLVRLVLDNVNINCNNSSAINIENAKKVIIVLEDNSINTITDGSFYATQDEPEGTLFSKDDLVITGNGILNVTGNYLDGIVSKDGLKILNTTINVIANDDGIRGKDYIGIKNSSIVITANSDGIKSTNDTDTEKGYIQIEESNISIKAGEDGIQAETIVNIKDGTFDILTNEGSENSSTKEGWENWNNKQMNNNTTNSTDEVSAKGIKGNLGILIENGIFTIDSSDDAIHSNGTIEINNGTFEISSGDDGIHADENIYINNGKINIKKSYEGIEASRIEINGGEINVIASDDGINIAGGNDSSSINGRPGQNSFTINTDRNLTINNGYISINASGDGIDLNGSGYMKGGTIIVDGPTSDGNGALDYDGEFVISGGTLIATGSRGMMQSPSTNSEQYSIAYTYSETQNSQSEVALKNSTGEKIVSFVPTKNYASVVISSDKLQKGEEYTLYSNEEKIEEITVNNVVTTSGNTTMNIGPGGRQPGEMNPQDGNGKMQPGEKVR